MLALLASIRSALRCCPARFADVGKMAGPRGFTAYAASQNLHLLAELDFGGPKEEVWATWIPLSGQDQSLAPAGLGSDLPGISPL